MVGARLKSNRMIVKTTRNRGLRAQPRLAHRIAAIGAERKACRLLGFF